MLPRVSKRGVGQRGQAEGRERRRYPRVGAPVFYRPAGLDFLHHRYNTRDISLGGMRVLSDEAVAVGSRLELDVLLPDESVVRCWATVIWADELNAEAKYEIGFRFTDMAEPDIQRLASVLVRPN
jgi:c-di-GMP-binding flagellar brake protein YcgR